MLCKGGNQLRTTNQPSRNWRFQFFKITTHVQPKSCSQAPQTFKVKAHGFQVPDFCNALATSVNSIPSFRSWARSTRNTLRSVSDLILLCLLIVLICCRSGRCRLSFCTMSGILDANSLPATLSEMASKDENSASNLSRTFLASSGEACSWCLACALFFQRPSVSLFWNIR